MVKYSTFDWGYSKCENNLKESHYCEGEIFEEENNMNRKYILQGIIIGELRRYFHYIDNINLYQ